MASTKAFLTQLVACYLIGLHLAQIRGVMYADEVAAVVERLRDTPDRAARAARARWRTVRALARDLKTATTVLFIGRHVGFPVALEGALKLKELAYMHAEGFAAGELKHGPIALIDEGTPVVCVVPSPAGRGVMRDKVVSNIQEVRARGARTIVIAEEGDEDVRAFADHLIPVPHTPDPAGPADDHGAAADPRVRDRGGPRPTTWTSRATWPSRSPSSDPARPGRSGHRSRAGPAGPWYRACRP